VAAVALVALAAVEVVAGIIAASAATRARQSSATRSRAKSSSFARGRRTRLRSCAQARRPAAGRRLRPDSATRSPVICRSAGLSAPECQRQQLAAPVFAGEDGREQGDQFEPGGVVEMLIGCCRWWRRSVVSRVSMPRLAVPRQSFAVAAGQRMGVVACPALRMDPAAHLAESRLPVRLRFSPAARSGDRDAGAAHFPERRRTGFARIRNPTAPTSVYEPSSGGVNLDITDQLGPGGEGDQFSFGQAV
jgi:hypothetical protein